MTVAGTIVADAAAAEFRASGTDLSERRRSGVSRGPLIDIPPSPEMTGIAWDARGAARIGALTPIAAIAADARLTAAYPGIAAAAAGLATPQIRRVATLGGNLAQRSRCWYFRNPRIDCLKKGGAACPAREGNHLYGVAFDLGPCVAPHPSTMAAALWPMTRRSDQPTPRLAIEQLLGDGSDGAADNALHPGEMIEAIISPPPPRRTRGLQARHRPRHGRMAAGRIVARVVVSDGAFRQVRLTAGGVAPVPIRLTAAEAAAEGAPISQATIEHAARAATQGAKPLPMTA